ncbi:MULTISPECIES: LLM class flavin-dependent oxidoreductase [Streptomyces]|uniref:LLM class flavin-dependent oxidoreductase n=1 Tax=Streptomyces doudnae TaxID=3075536 RepID=A0ABD5EXQ1_9ACTN|nr:MULTISPECIES: LLM class flavin-dependent oxidoreductase [unclassified Streptomyces]MDT0438635.1 LLM class flavin-dependent oxidoreductase [Streptomyces sp. DSM 41981]MYQ69061.1 LLM class flavin-dependent oxidoreductase [Streptomyces sp. SID4950]SCE51107.1 Flavin-dependent oxidoreductase, luciferase family (includes alkanesulfonate monooxygenase SsuD and methylene tetrahydromethanopterin reductase) [Streptomyces sp. SolWspMP-5a-2]
MKLCANWLPINPDLTRLVARGAERAGLWGLGIGDSPHYDELYGACAQALMATDRLTVLPSVTNPATRHVSVHSSAARGLGALAPGRFAIGMGRGDSAVRTFGLAPASLKEVERHLEALREQAPGVPLMLAASGPKAAAAAGRCADALIAGAGLDLTALRGLRARAQEERARSERAGAVEVWGSVRIGIARRQGDIPALRRRLLARAVSASRFNFAATFEGKNVPDEYQPVLAERYASYDFAWHGRSGHSPVADLFADRPDIESYLLDRFAIIGTVEECRERVDGLTSELDGLFLSLLFEDALPQLDLLSHVTAGLVDAS